jgi:hypothetical protein
MHKTNYKVNFMQTKIFTLLDEERKILSFAISEIVFTMALAILGFAFHALIIAISSMFCGVFIMRYIKAKLKKSGFAKKLFFILSDLIYAKEIKYYGKHYL